MGETGQEGSQLCLGPNGQLLPLLFQLSIGIGHGLDMNCLLAPFAGPGTRRRAPSVLVWAELALLVPAEARPVHAGLGRTCAPAQG